LAVLSAVDVLPRVVPGITAIALVGSWARDVGRSDSDVDLVVLSREPERLLSNDSWWTVFGAGAELIRSRDFGQIQERRLRLQSGLEVEVGIGGPEWAATDPPDDGSVEVIRDGIQVLSDPEGLLRKLGAAVE
jgi:hypothetical protein